MHTCFVNRFYAPDQSATAQLLTDLAEHMAGLGQSVTVVTSDLSYEGSKLPSGKHKIEGVNVVRVRTTKFGRANRLGRMIDYATFYISAGFTLLGLLQKDWLCIAKTDPPLISVVCGLACFFKRAKLVNWVQDRFPEVALELGVKLPPGTYSVARLLRDWSTNYAAMNVAIGDGMKSLIMAKSGAKNCEVIPNWAVGDFGSTMPSESHFRRSLQLDPGKIVIGYSGNLGQAHQWEILFSLASRLVDIPELVFVIVGGGDGYVKLKARSEGLPNTIFKPYQPLETLSDSLAAFDLHIVLLKPELEGLIVPSKIYGVLAAERPVLYFGDPEGEIGKLISTNSVGWAYSDKDIDEAVQRLSALDSFVGDLAEVQANSAKLKEHQTVDTGSLDRWVATISTTGSIRRSSFDS